MINKDIYFMPLGGAQEVGRSCYYLRLGHTNILLDCGIKRTGKLVASPRLDYLLTSPFMDSMQQLDHVYISHAHSDHIGYLPQLMTCANNAAVYMTVQTRQLAQYRLYENMKGRMNTELLQAQLAKAAAVNYLQTIEHKDYKVSFYPAGHIPGAMMTLFEYAGRRILYTGDFSAHSAFGLKGYWLPDDLQVDVLLMCALHAKQPHRINRKNTLTERIDEVIRCLRQGIPVYMQAFDGSRVLEILSALNQAMQQNQELFPIYLEPKAMAAVEMMEMLQIPILQQNNFSSFYKQEQGPHVVIGTRLKEEVDWYYRLFGNSYTLHEDYAEMKQFIRKLNPKQAYLVHCAEGNCSYTVEQELMLDAQCRTQVEFPEEGELYTI